MKNIKLFYVYILGIVIAVFAIMLVSNNNSQLSQRTAANVPPPIDIAGKQMPNDKIHDNLGNPINQTPGKNNVLPDIMQHMQQLKNEVEKHPDDTLAIRQYADFLSDAHQYNKAKIYYKKILNRYPRRIDILSSLVFISFNENNLNESGQYLNRILSIDKNNVEAMYNLGAVAANKGDKSKAKLLWSKIINNHPDSPLAQKAKDSISHL